MTNVQCVVLRAAFLAFYLSRAGVYVGTAPANAALSLCCTARLGMSRLGIVRYAVVSKRPESERSCQIGQLRSLWREDARVRIDESKTEGGICDSVEPSLLPVPCAR